MADPKTAPEQANLPPGYSPHAIHVLRTVQNNTLKLSQMADQKASILMGASFVVFSIAVSRAFAGHVPWSLAVLALFAFLSSLCAMMAVLPRLSGSLPPGAERNRLFFGHFHDLDEEQWTREVLAELRTDERAFRLMLHDIYQNGQVLQQRKYRYLGLAYRLFVAGLVATLAAFAAETALAYA
ncbi:MAG TPA: Pycsar system effector family protein [Croceibacterium sp.]|nr:Pycsar system effector family protein [Croceibacterium sp.]